VKTERPAQVADYCRSHQDLFGIVFEASDDSRAPDPMDLPLAQIVQLRCADQQSHFQQAPGFGGTRISMTVAEVPGSSASEVAGDQGQAGTNPA
jgi:hypothetical protein